MTMQHKRQIKWMAGLSGLVLILAAAWALTAGPLSASANQPANADAKAEGGADKKGSAPGKAETPSGKSAGTKPSGPPPALVRVGPTDERMLQSRRNVIGRLREIKRTIVGSGQQGRVIICEVEEGDAVVAHETVLAKIDETFVKISLNGANAAHDKAIAEHKRMESEVVKARATLAEVKAVHERLNRDVNHLKELLNSNSAKRKEYDDAVSLVKAAAARIDAESAAVLTAEADVLTAAAVKDSTQADIDRVKQEVKRFTIIAPFDGVVVRKIMEVGQWVQKGAPVVELVSRGEIDAVVDVPEHVINNINVGSDVDITVDALRQTVEGKVAAIIPLGETVARSFPVKVRMDDLKGQLKSGMSVTALIPTSEKKPHITVPRDAILRSASDTIVWAVIDGKAMRISIDVLFAEGDRFAVKSARRNTGPSIEPGMQVIIEGGERLLFPGHPVNIAPPASE